jgi:hypothetical protein
MATGIEIIIGTLLAVGIPLLLIVIWLVRRRQLRRRAAMELKSGNQIYSQWRSSGTNRPLK